MKCYFCGKNMGEAIFSSPWRMWYFTNDLEHDYEYLTFSPWSPVKADFRCTVMCRHKDVYVRLDLTKEEVGDICEKVNSLMKLSFSH